MTNLVPLKSNSHGIGTPRYDPASKDPQTKFPLDSCTDISSLTDETFIDLFKTAPILYTFGGTRIVRLS
ncbi:hypothetical protein BO78DRAFT_423809 [Aspergillus sclerotiicarbonarius CBS 121057]|uniref:Uncharacterized protein n=1 Tax=Aspergillus sclerotiicarbonarius (strain CBS 121057 / IBT 28362) TaxID=1448318 RepID=A0A319F723_ASPSB|nr:hypothetical protein BO78DRAFT_423809 [Aspergillus sclerotiicarbonarius CBS 121057]